LIQDRLKEIFKDKLKSKGQTEDDQKTYELMQISEEHRQLISLYDNLAVYSDYLMRLIKGEEVHEIIKDKKHEPSHFSGKGTNTGLALIKKSNDIKGNLESPQTTSTTHPITSTKLRKKKKRRFSNSTSQKDPNCRSRETSTLTSQKTP